MSLKIIDVAGLKKSGKTTVIENLVRELSSRGYKVGTIKKIHIPDFSIDQQGKDTYRHKQAGAEFVISLAPDEIALIKSFHGRRELSEIMSLIPKGTDFLVCEELNEERDDIYYIITLKELGDFEKTLQIRAIGKNVVAISGVVSNLSCKHEQYPIINAIEEGGRKRIVDLILKQIK